MAIQLDLTVGVQKRIAVVKTHQHSNFGCNVVFETFEIFIYIYIYIVRPVVKRSPQVATGGPLETTGNHKGSSRAQNLAA